MGIFFSSQKKATHDTLEPSIFLCFLNSDVGTKEHREHWQRCNLISKNTCCVFLIMGDHPSTPPPSLFLCRDNKIRNWLPGDDETMTYHQREVNTLLSDTEVFIQNTFLTFLASSKDFMITSSRQKSEIENATSAVLTQSTFCRKSFLVFLWRRQNSFRLGNASISAGWEDSCAPLPPRPT